MIPNDRAINLVTHETTLTNGWDQQQFNNVKLEHNTPEMLFRCRVWYIISEADTLISLFWTNISTYASHLKLCYH